MSLALANATIRLAYGLVVVAAPSKTADTGMALAPNTDDLPEARLFVRGFAAHQIAVGLVGLASVRRRDLHRAGMLLAAGIDLVDIVTALIEARARRRLDPDLTGGIAFSGVGLASALAALR